MINVIKTIKFAIAATAGVFALAACEESPNIGSSLIQDETEVVVFSDFTVTGRSVDNPRVQSRTVTQVLGRINAKGYGSFSSDFVTQFMPSVSIDTKNLTADNIDSLKLLMFVPKGSFIGDSVAPMGLEVYRLNKQLPSLIYSDDSPSKYYNEADLLGSRIYACNALGATDSIRNLSYRLIDVPLPLSLARELYNLYITDPSAYAFPSNFAKHFPGIYVKNSFGDGRVVEVTSTLIRMYYHTTSTDSEGKEEIKRYQGNYYAVTPEIILNNNLIYKMSDDLKRRINDGEQIIVAPVGRDIEMTFPIREVIDYYKANAGTLSVINTLSMDIPAETITNDYGITPPENLLLILSKEKDDFFLRSELNNDITSFYASYDAEKKRYRFSGLRPYLLDMLKKDNIKPEDYTFTITPVNIETETNSSNSYYGTTTTYVSAINPYIGAPTMTRLDLSKATVNFTFSKQTMK